MLPQVALAVPAHYSMSNLGYLYMWEKLDAVEWHVCESVIEYSHPVIGCHHKWSSLEKSTVEKQLSSLIATTHLMC